MTLNYDTKKTHFQFDSSRMVRVKGDDLSWRDSIGWTVLAWLSNGKPKKLSNALDNCLKYNSEKNIYELRRHPLHMEKSSRDHWSYYILFLKLRETAEGIPMKLSFLSVMKRLPSMRGMNLWIKALRGERRAERLFYAIQIPGAWIALKWYNFIRWACDFHRECPEAIWDQFRGEILEGMSRRQKIGRKIIMKTVPPYSLQVKAWQLFIMNPSEKLNRLKRILVKRTGPYNYQLHKLLGSNVDELLASGATIRSLSERYRQMTGDRFGVNLDESNDRDVHFCTEEETEYNNLERMILDYIYSL